jgi:RNA polymerase sigma-70 factor (ECF subfamily)
MCATLNEHTRQFERLISKYEWKLMRHAFQFSRNATDAQDLFQETCIKIYRNMHKLKTEETFLAWAIRIMERTHIDKRRRNRLHVESIDAQNPQDNPREFAGPEDIHRDIESQEDFDFKMLLINSLPKPMRAALYLREVEGLSYKEIADKLDENIETLKTRVFRSKARLRALSSSSALMGV